MSTISIMCVDQSLKVASSPLITAGDENEDYVQFSFCSSWNGYAKVAIFYRNKSELHYSIVGNDNRCTIPNSMLIDEGVLCIGVVGFKNDGSTYKTRTTEVLRYNIAEGALQGESIEDPTLAALFYKQIESAEISEENHLLIHLMDNTTIDAGEVAGGGGESKSIGYDYEAIVQLTGVDEVPQKFTDGTPVIFNTNYSMDELLAKAKEGSLKATGGILLTSSEGSKIGYRLSEVVYGIWPYEIFKGSVSDAAEKDAIMHQFIYYDFGEKENDIIKAKSKFYFGLLIYENTSGKIVTMGKGIS